MTHTPHLLAPRETPDGVVSWEESQPELARRIREGDAALGWLGDDRLSLHCNVKFAREVDLTDPRSGKGVPKWEIWRRLDDGTSALVGSLVTLRIQNGDGLIRRLAAGDARTHDHASEMLERRARADAKAKGDARDGYADKADKLAWALGRDLSLPAQSGRVFSLGG